MTAVVTLLSAGEAQRLTQRIKLTASSVRDGLFKLRNLVEEAKSSNAWQVLGFQSWTAYLADTLADEPMRLGRDERQELVGYLAGEGLSTRAIAPIVAVTHETVAQDLKAPVRNLTPEPPVEPAAPVATGESAARVEVPPAPPRAADQPTVLQAVEAPVEPGEDAPTPPVRDDAPPRVITGLDGKSYTAPVAKPEDEELSATKYDRAFHKAVKEAGKVFLFDPERVALVADADSIRSLEDHVELVTKFLGNVRKSRSGLRLIEGGKK